VARNSKVGKKRSSGNKPRPVDTKGRGRRGRPKVCLFCAHRTEWVDYKDINVLRRYVNDRGRIRARGATGTCSQHQRDVAVAIKTARELALMPYSVRTGLPGPGERRGGDRQGRPSSAASVEEPAEAKDAPEVETPSEEAEAVALS
jgi:small subunit ribosomal protein S18